MHRAHTRTSTQLRRRQPQPRIWPWWILSIPERRGIQVWRMNPSCLGKWKQLIFYYHEFIQFLTLPPLLKNTDTQTHSCLSASNNMDKRGCTRARDNTRGEGGSRLVRVQWVFPSFIKIPLFWRKTVLEIKRGCTRARDYTRGEGGSRLVRVQWVCLSFIKIPLFWRKTVLEIKRGCTRARDYTRGEGGSRLVRVQWFRLILSFLKPFACH